MRTTSTLWQDEQYRLATERNAVLIITTEDSETLGIGRTSMQLTDVVVYPLLNSINQMKESFNPFTKKWPTTSVVVRASNKPFRAAATPPFGVTRRLSDIIGQVRFASASVVLFLGKRMTNYATDALTWFDGIIVEQPKYDNDVIEFRLQDKFITVDKVLPSNLVSDNFSEAPINSIKKKIPLVYGSFSPVSDTADGTGLAVGIPVDGTAQPRQVVADHVLKSITAHYTLIDNFVDVCLLDDSILTTNDGGYGTVTFFSSGPPFDAFVKLRPIDNHNGEYDTASPGTDITNYTRAFDRRNSTFAELLDYIDDGADITGHAVFAWDDYATGGRYDNEIGEMQDFALGGIEDYKLEVVLEDALGVSYSTKIAEIIYGYAGATDDIFNSQSFTAGEVGTKQMVQFTENFLTDPPALRDDFAWHFRSGSVDNVGGEDWPFNIHLKFITGTNADSTTLNKTMIKIFDIRLRIRFWLKKQGTTFVHCEGRTYGSWITGRSSNYASGDLIEDPAGIIESILRDELGLANADIDMPSFIAAENTAMKARINFHSDNEMTAGKAIRQIAEQSTFAFVYSASGKARLIPLKAFPNTGDRVISYFDIIGDIKVAREKFLVNQIIAEHEYHQEYDAFLVTETFDDGSSQSTFGTFSYDATWPNITGSSVTELADTIVNAGRGIWSTEHALIMFKTRGFVHADLEVGDWIEIAGADAVQLLDGDSWRGHFFLITTIEQSEKETTITAHEVLRGFSVVITPASATCVAHSIDPTVAIGA